MSTAPSVRSTYFCDYPQKRSTPSVTVHEEVQPVPRSEVYSNYYMHTLAKLPDIRRCGIVDKPGEVFGVEVDTPRVENSASPMSLFWKKSVFESETIRREVRHILKICEVYRFSKYAEEGSLQGCKKKKYSSHAFKL